MRTEPSLGRREDVIGAEEKEEERDLGECPLPFTAHEGRHEACMVCSSESRARKPRNPRGHFGQHDKEGRQMRQAKWAALLAVVCLSPLSAWAQRPFQPPPRPIQPPGFAPPSRGDDRGARRIDRLMDRLRDEMWAYRQDLSYFQRAPEYNQLRE